MKGATLLFYRIILFLYVLAIPFYLTNIIPLTKTIVWLPLLLIPWLDTAKRYVALLKLDIIKWLGIYILFLFLTCYFVEDKSLGFLQILDFLIALSFLIIVLIMATYSRSLLKLMFAAFLIGLILSLGIGFYQNFVDNTFRITHFELNANTAESINGSINYRVGGPFSNSLSFSNYLSVCGIVIIAIFLNTRKHGYLLLSLIVLGFVSYGIVLTQGRTAIVFFIIAVYLAFLNRYIQKRVSKVIFSLIFFVPGILILGTLYSDQFAKLAGMVRFFNTTQDFNHGRLDNWVYGFTIIERSPFFGAGVGNLNLTLKSMNYNFPSAKIIYYHNGHLESTFFTILATNGVIGFGIFMYWIFLITKKMLSTLKTVTGPFHNYLMAAAYGWFVLLGNMVTNPAFLIDYRIMFLFLLIGAIPYILDNYLVKWKINFSEQ